MLITPPAEDENILYAYPLPLAPLAMWARDIVAREESLRDVEKGDLRNRCMVLLFRRVLLEEMPK